MQNYKSSFSQLVCMNYKPHPLSPLHLKTIYIHSLLHTRVNAIWNETFQQFYDWLDSPVFSFQIMSIIIFLVLKTEQC